MSTTLNTKIQLRTDTKQNWETKNPILKLGEVAVVCFENDYKDIKIGNGISAFNELSYLYQNAISADTITGKDLHVKSIAQGYNVKATPTSLATGIFAQADGNFDVVHGIEAKANVGDDYAFVFNGTNLPFDGENFYTSHGEGTFNINPLDGLSGFYIGEQNLATILSNYYALSDEINGEKLIDNTVSEYKTTFISCESLSSLTHESIIYTDLRDNTVLWGDGSVHTNTGYKWYSFIAPCDFDIWFDTITSKICHGTVLILGIYSGEPAGTSTFISPLYRLNKSNNTNTLPTESNKLHINSGRKIVFAHYSTDNNYSFTAHVKYLTTSKVLADDIRLNNYYLKSETYSMSDINDLSSTQMSLNNVLKSNGSSLNQNNISLKKNIETVLDDDSSTGGFYGIKYDDINNRLLLGTHSDGNVYSLSSDDILQKIIPSQSLKIKNFGVGIYQGHRDIIGLNILNADVSINSTLGIWVESSNQVVATLTGGFTTQTNIIQINSRHFIPGASKDASNNSSVAIFYSNENDLEAWNKVLYSPTTKDEKYSIGCQLILDKDNNILCVPSDSHGYNNTNVFELLRFNTTTLQFEKTRNIKVELPVGYRFSSTWACYDDGDRIIIPLALKGSIKPTMVMVFIKETEKFFLGKFNDGLETAIRGITKFNECYYAVGYDGLIYKSENGLTWTKSLEFGNHFEGIEAYNGFLYTIQRKSSTEPPSIKKFEVKPYDITIEDINEALTDPFKTISLIKPYHQNRLNLQIDISETQDFSSTYSLDTSVSSGYLKAFSLSSWEDSTISGLGPDFNNHPVIFNLRDFLTYNNVHPNKDTLLYARYRWFTDDELRSYSDWYSSVVPTNTEVGANANDVISKRTFNQLNEQVNPTVWEIGLDDTYGEYYILKKNEFEQLSGDISNGQKILLTEYDFSNSYRTSFKTISTDTNISVDFYIDYGNGPEHADGLAINSNSFMPNKDYTIEIKHDCIIIESLGKQDIVNYLKENSNSVTLRVWDI